MSVRSLASAAGHKSLGVAFLALLLFFVWGTYAIFTKKFVDYVPVTLETSKIGLQLPALADVKIRGVIVGDVRGISSQGDKAKLEPRIAYHHPFLDPKFGIAPNDDRLRRGRFSVRVIGKAYSGLTDAEIRKVDAFVRRNTREKFGPVRTVAPELVFELAGDLTRSYVEQPGCEAPSHVLFPQLARIVEWFFARRISAIGVGYVACVLGLLAMLLLNTVPPSIAFGAVSVA